MSNPPGQQVAQEAVQPVQQTRDVGQKPKPFVLGGDERRKWKLWEASFNWYANNVELSKMSGSRQVTVFLSCLGPEIVDILEGFDLTATEMTQLATVTKKFREHFNAQDNPAYEAWVFNRADQEEGETFIDFVTKLKAQVKRCSFTETGNNMVNRLVRDRIICGVRSEPLRTKLLEEKDLTLDKAVTIGKAYEAAVSQSKKMAEDFHETKSEVNLVKRGGAIPKRQGCSFCGRVHKPRECPAFGKTCGKCGKIGHFRDVCRNRASASTKKVDKDDDDSDSSEEKVVDSLKVFQVRGKNDDNRWSEKVLCGGKRVKMAIDTGAQCSVMSAKTAELIGVSSVQKSPIKRLVTYSGDKIPVKGRAFVSCVIRGEAHRISFQVIDQDCATILDGDSAVQAKLISRVQQVTTDQKDDSMYGFGELKEFVYDADIIENPQFVKHPPRKIPHRSREAIKKELDKMVELGVIELCLEPTEAVSPLVIVRRNGKIRLCIDLTDVNKNLKRCEFPLNGLEEIAARIAGSKVFTLLDCTKGFWQVPLSKRTSRLCTFSTPWGRYSCKRLPFGLSTAPELFQQIMMQMLGDLSGVEVSMDDILIHAEDEETLRKITKEVTRRLTENGMKLNAEKCVFNKHSLQFLGHLVTSEGLKVCPNKVEAIQKMPSPSNKEDLRTFLGMVTYLAKFIPNLSRVTEPLRDLVNKAQEYKWKTEHQEAFETIKKSLQEAPVLQFFKVGDPVVLSVDSSSRAYGAVLMQNDLPVAYATRSLTRAEQNYPQLEKEAGAIRFGCTKFHSYIWGAPITIETDHKPLEVIFRKPLVDAPPRLRRILYDVKPYSPKVVYKPGKDIPVADALSRICAPEEATPEEVMADEREVYAISCLEKSAEVRYRKATSEDKDLQDLIKYIMTGWPDHVSQVKQSARNYFTFKEEISVFEGIVYKGEKIIVPRSERALILKLVHGGHNGINATTRLAREFVYWPGMAAEIKEYVEKCRVCQQTQAAKQKEEIFLKKIPEYPFQVVASDLFHFATYDFVLLVDSFSGFYEFKKLPESSSEEVIRFLKEKFALFGCPEELHTDGGPQYSSKAFIQFTKDWGIKHEKSSPGFPRANGLAERYVQKAKKLIKKCALSGEDIRHALLLQRNVPKEGLGSPVERLMGRRTRTNLCAARELASPKTAPAVTELLQKSREKQKHYADRGAQKFKEIPITSRIRMRNPDGSWSSGEVKEKKGERSYVVELDDGRELWRNSHFIEPTRSTGPIIPDRYVKFPELVEMADGDSGGQKEQTGVEVLEETQLSKPETAEVTSQMEQPGPSTERYFTRSGREVKPPQRLGY